MRHWVDHQLRFQVGVEENLQKIHNFFASVRKGVAEVARLELEDRDRLKQFPDLPWLGWNTPSIQVIEVMRNGMVSQREDQIRVRFFHNVPKMRR